MSLVIQASYDQKYAKERGRHIDLNILHSKTTATIGSIAESSTSQILSLRVEWIIAFLIIVLHVMLNFQNKLFDVQIVNKK